MLRTYLIVVLAGMMLSAPSWGQEHALGRLDIARFEVEGNTLLPAAKVQEAVAPYAGKQRSFADIRRAVAALEEAYRRRGFALVQVGLPEQELDGGVVRLRVYETRLGKVTVEGNRYFDEANIRRSVPGLRAGESPNVDRISESLATANENPAKRTRLQLRHDAKDDVDAVLSVVDERTWSAGLTVDNTGTESTGKTRVGALYQNANMFGLDHVLGLQFTTSLEMPDQVQVYGVGYHIPLYGLGDSIDLFATYSDIDSGTVAAGAFALAVSGSGTTWGGRYNQHLPRFGDLESKLAYGFDYKAYRNNALLEGTQLGNDITVHPISLGYFGTWTGTRSDAGFSLTALRNIPGGDKGSQDDFDAARAGAPADYSLLRYSASYGRTLGDDWQLRARLNGQFASQSLVSGEQFGAGGAQSVRGFQEREIADDYGHQLSLEAYTPELCARIEGWNASCRVLVFTDYARVSRNNALPGESSGASIGSIGIGLRASLGRNASLQADLGQVTDAGPVSQKGDLHMHVRLALTY